MGHTHWQRARTEDQVQTRIDQILDAAAELFRGGDFGDVTVGKIAQKAGFTRSNVYRYFSSLEEIFLTLYVGDAQGWATEVKKTFTSAMGEGDFVGRWVDVLLSHRRLLDLTPLLAPVLERHCSPESYREAKRALARVGADLGPAITAAQPQLDAAGSFEFLRANQMLMAGAWPMSRRTDWQDEILDQMKLENMKIDFVEVLRSTLLVFLAGLARGGVAEPRPRPPGGA